MRRTQAEQETLHTMRRAVEISVFFVAPGLGLLLNHLQSAECYAPIPLFALLPSYLVHLRPLAEPQIFYEIPPHLLAVIAYYYSMSETRLSSGIDRLWVSTALVVGTAVHFLIALHMMFLLLLIFDQPLFLLAIVPPLTAWLFWRALRRVMPFGHATNRDLISGHIVLAFLMIAVRVCPIRSSVPSIRYMTDTCGFLFSNNDLINTSAGP